MSNLNGWEKRFRCIRGLLNPRPEWEQKKTSGNRSMPFRQDNKITNPVWKVGTEREIARDWNLAKGKGRLSSKVCVGARGEGGREKVRGS